MHLDTCFLIDLHRERMRKAEGPAHRLLQENAGESFAISAPVVMEYCEGFPSEELWKGLRFVEGFLRIDIGGDAAIRASRNRRSLRLSGALLPDNDIWIAACALESNETLVTRNADHFRRIEGLSVRAY